MPSRKVWMIFAAFFLLSTKPAHTAENARMSDAAKKLEQIADGVPGLVGYYVMTVDGETLFSRNEDRLFTQASAIKIPILLEAIAQREAGKIDWSKHYPITKSNQVSGSGILSQLSDGGSQISTGDLAIMMIVLSDNTATNLLIDLVGMENVNQRLDSLGCPRTRLRRVMMDTAAAERGEENVSTPAEAAKIMQTLAQRKFLSPNASDEVLAILRKPKSTAVRKAIPAEIPIANKPGGIPGVATEWALVEYADRPYIITLMGKDGEEARFLETFTEIAKCVHQAVASKP